MSLIDYFWIGAIFFIVIGTKNYIVNVELTIRGSISEYILGVRFFDSAFLKKHARYSKKIKCVVEEAIKEVGINIFELKNADIKRIDNFIVKSIKKVGNGFFEKNDVFPTIVVGYPTNPKILEKYSKNSCFEINMVSKEFKVKI